MRIYTIFVLSNEEMQNERKKQNKNKNLLSYDFVLFLFLLILHKQNVFDCLEKNQTHGKYTHWYIINLNNNMKY